MFKQLILFFKKIFEGPISIVFFRLLGYPKPYRLALIRVLSMIFKKFRPHYHSVIYESTQLALKLNLKKGFFILYNGEDYLKKRMYHLMFFKFLLLQKFLKGFLI